MSLEHNLETQVDKVLQSKTLSWLQRFFGSRSGSVLVGLVSVFEAALPLPILTDPFLVAAILANRTKAVWLVIMTTVTSVIGGVMAYFMALYSFEWLQQWMSVELQNSVQVLVDTNEMSTLMLTLVGAITPVPYTIVGWGVAILEGSLLIFIIASVLGRGFRYAVVGYCTFKFGEAAIAYAKRYIIVASFVVILLAVLILWYKM
jgi:membrane protein YqaA with SNARE-associated domain